MLDCPYTSFTRLWCFSGPGDCELSHAISYDGALVSAQICSFGRALLATVSFSNRPETCGSICSKGRRRVGSWKPLLLCDPIFTSWESTSWHSLLVFCIHHNTALMSSPFFDCLKHRKLYPAHTYRGKPQQQQSQQQPQQQPKWTAKIRQHMGAN